MDARTLAKIVYEELDKEAWGDIDPYLFYLVATDETDLDVVELDCVRGLKLVLERVCARLNPK